MGQITKADRLRVTRDSQTTTTITTQQIQRQNPAPRYGSLVPPLDFFGDTDESICIVI